ncbi:MAG: chemotaxis protein CheW [bacterium]
MEIQDGKHLTFSLGNEEYGIPILKVKEIIGLMEITHVPQTPEFIKGVINLRGKIIPIMDLRLKFKMSEKDYNERTCIIVVEVNINQFKRLMGIVVDTVSEVVNIQSSEIEPPPQYGSTKIETGFLTGLGKVKGKVVMLLNIETIINCDEIVSLLGSETKVGLVNV